MKDNINFNMQCPACSGFFIVTDYSLAGTKPEKSIVKTKCPGCGKEFGVSIQINYYEFQPVKINKDI